MSPMVRVNSREELADAPIRIGGQNLKLDMAQLRNSQDGKINLIFDISFKAPTKDNVSLTTFSISSTPGSSQEKPHAAAEQQLMMSKVEK